MRRDFDKIQGNTRLIAKGFITSTELTEESYITPSETTLQGKSTITEPILTTLTRDLTRIMIKVKCVLLPNYRDREATLKQWDLWGPLIFCMTLALTLSQNSDHDARLIFSSIIVLLWLGSVVIILNAQLLGAKISLFQGLCILGYCLIPINITSLIVELFVPSFSLVLRLGIIGFGFLWATTAALGFIHSIVKPEKKWVVFYPIILFYLFLSWFCVAI